MELQPKDLNKLDTFVANYYGISVRYLKLPGNNVLLNTNDICYALGIINRSVDEDLSISCLDLVSAVSIANGYSIDFTQ
jgi:hypothetical protein